MNTTTHPVSPEEVMALLDGELSAERRQFLSSHVESCAECRALADALHNSSELLSNWTVASVPAQLEERIGMAIEQVGVQAPALGTRRARRTIGWPRRQWVLGLAGTAVLAVLLFALSTPRLNRSSIRAKQASSSFGVVSVDNAGASDNPSATPMGYPRALGRMTTKAGNPSATPMIARSVSLSVVVKDFDAGRAALDTILARHNGYAAGLNVSTPQGSVRTLQGSLRIPAPQMAAAVAELKVLGRVEAETQNGEEVTEQHADLLARLQNSRETEQRLQDVLRTRTGKVKDVLEVEQEIARVRGEIEQMEAEQQTLEHRVDFATIDLKLVEEYKAQLNPPAPSVSTQLRNASVNGFRNAFESMMALVLFLAASGPTLLLWAFVLCFPAWLVWRRYRRSFEAVSTIGA